MSCQRGAKQPQTIMCKATTDNKTNDSLLARDGHWCASCVSRVIAVASHCPCNRLYIRDICCQIGDTEGILRSSIRHGLLPK